MYHAPQTEIVMVYIYIILYTMTEALELAIYLQRKLKHASDSCLSRNTCFRELNYARSEESRIQRELLLLEKRGQHIDPKIVAYKRKLRTLHLINLRRDQTQLMDQVKYYTRVANIVNNSIPLIKQVYLKGAEKIKSKITDEVKKEKVTDALTKLKTAETKCAVISYMAIISKALQFLYQNDTKSHGVDIASDLVQSDTKSPSSSGSDSSSSDSESNQTSGNVDEISDSQSSIDGKSSMKPGDVEIQEVDPYQQSWDDATCPLEDYADFVGRVDYSHLDQADIDYQQLRSEIEHISSTGVMPRPEGSRDGIQIATGLAYLFLEPH